MGGQLSAQIDRIGSAVISSGGTSFITHNIPVPDWWPEASRDIAKTVMPVLQNEVRLALEQHDKDIERKEKSLRNRLIKVGIALITLLLGALLGWIANLFH